MLRRITTLAIVVGLVSLAALACGGDEAPTATATPRPTPTSTATPTATPTPAPTPTLTPVPAPPPPSVSVSVTRFTVDLRDGGGPGPFSFEPADFSFSVGDTVDFTFISETQFHTFTVDDLGIDVPIDGGATVNFEYTFDKPGTYELICIPHQALGMVGTITVQ